ncbi:MAG: Na+/H+ antiporter subunit E [Spirochaeta sp.]
MRYLLVGALLLVIWLLLVNSLTAVSIGLGVFVSSLSVFVFRSALGGGWTDETPHPRSPHQWLLRLAGAAAFLPVYIWKILSSGVEIALFALRPSITFWPGIVQIKTDLPSLSAATALADLMTLTPGTLSIEYIREEDLLFVHWIDVSEYQADTVDEQVTSGMRPFLKRVFA